ncbi:MAG: hypothetical protein ACP5VR_01900 [Acidimicrobiales bacterium]
MAPPPSCKFVASSLCQVYSWRAGVVVVLEAVLAEVVVPFEPSEVVEVAVRACPELPQAGRASAASAPSATAVVRAASLLRRQGDGTGSNLHR